jgi:hypothetical protein
MTHATEREGARNSPLPRDQAKRKDTQADWLEVYRQERGRHWQPRGLTKRDRLQVTRRYTRVWP